MFPLLYLPPSSPSLRLCLMFSRVYNFLRAGASQSSCTQVALLMKILMLVSWTGHEQVSPCRINFFFFSCVCERQRETETAGHSVYLCLDLVGSLSGLCFCAVCVWQRYLVLNRIKTTHQTTSTFFPVHLWWLFLVSEFKYFYSVWIICRNVFARCQLNL